MPNNIVLAAELGAEFDIGVEVANKISVKTDGTSVTKVAGVLGAPPPAWDAGAATLTFPAAHGAAPLVVPITAVRFMNDPNAP